MHLFNDLIRDIDKIDKATLDISSFGSKYREDQFLDFKHSSPINPLIGKPTDYHKGEFVKDVSALANTSGMMIRMPPKGIFIDNLPMEFCNI